MHLVTVRSTASDFERESLLASLARLIPASSLPGSPSNPEDCPLFVLVGLRTADDDNDNDSPTLPQPFSFRGLSPRALARLRRPPCLSIPSIPSLRAALAADPIFSARDIVFVNLIGAHLASKDAHLASAKALFDSLCLLINFILLPAKRSNPQPPPDETPDLASFEATGRKVYLIEREELLAPDFTLSVADDSDRSILLLDLIRRFVRVP
ncbi:hypothetical protein BZA70DRAFT_284324 [Myxozyma melibiosi]|uniref:Uncharacterized protein n=1 Tax=Myxozyma melibiosi TaxID=54550 RepID=A0ABR1EZD6_9ASCO